MAQQEEPLYDFPEPSQQSEQKFLGHQRGQGSLKSISVLDRLLLTVPVWLQLSVNPATALHILQREPPGTFIVRKSSTSKRNVLCVRLVDDSVPSFVQQFEIREQHSTLSLVTSAISFPDLPRLISFYCVSRDVLPFPLELPEAIAKATSHKELESISHMGIEFWSSHLNVRGPREPPKPQKEKRPEIATSAAPPPVPQSSPAVQLSSTCQPDLDKPATAAGPDCTQSSSTPTPTSTPTLFHEFCPITTRSPRELDCGSGLGALCFINPLFLQSQNVLSRRRMFKRSLKVRLSTETSTLLSPPLAPPPPPPLMPKTKGKCKARKQGASQHGQKDPGLLCSRNLSHATDILPSSQNAKLEPPTQEPSDESQVQPSANFQLPPAMQAQVQGMEFTARLPTVMEQPPEESDYMQPSPSLFPGSLSPIPPSLFPKVSQTLSPHDSPCPSPSVSPYNSPSLSPKAPIFLSPHASPTASPYQSPSPSPIVPFTPLPSASWPQLAEETYHTPAPFSRSDKVRSMSESGETGRRKDENMDEDNKTDKHHKETEEGVEGLVLQIDAASLKDTETAETPTCLTYQQDFGANLM